MVTKAEQPAETSSTFGPFHALKTISPAASLPTEIPVEALKVELSSSPVDTSESSASPFSSDDDREGFDRNDAPSDDNDSTGMRCIVEIPLPNVAPWFWEEIFIRAPVDSAVHVEFPAIGNLMEHARGIFLYAGFTLLHGCISLECLYLLVASELLQ